MTSPYYLPPPQYSNPPPPPQSRRSASRTILILLLTLVAPLLILMSCLGLVLAAGESTSQPLPQGTTSGTGIVTSSPTQAASPGVKAPVVAAPKVSTCDAAREAFLTGTPAQIEAALRALIADREAPPVAREYAQYYLERDAGRPSMRTSDMSIIRMTCS